MKNKNLFKRIILIFFIVLILLFMPITSYFQSNNHFVYASEQVIKEAAKVIIPLTGYMTYSYKNNIETAVNINTTDLANEIQGIRDKFDETYDFISVSTKALMAYVFTQYSVNDINNIYGTSYSENTLANDMGGNAIKQKILANEPLTEYEMQKLGVMELAAYTLKYGLYGNVAQKGTVAFNGSSIYTRMIDNKNFFVENQSNKSLYLWDIIPGQVIGSQHQSVYDTLQYVTTNATYYLNIDNQYYKIEYKLLLLRAFNVDLSVMAINNILGFETASSYNNVYHQRKLKLYSMENGAWVQQYTNPTATNGTTVAEKRALLDMLGTLTGYNFKTTDVYISSLSIDQFLDNTFDGDNVNVGNADKAFTVLMPTAGILDGLESVPDNNIDAEEIKTAIDNLGTQVQALEYGLNTYTNPDTNDEDIIIGVPTGSIPSVDTGSTAEDFPDTSGDLGEGTINIPILGSILAWLKSLVELVRRILEQLLNNPGADEGIDWGNFGGLFDLFFIFYYLIVMAILLLIKFLAVVMNILSIPANTELFNSYPSILQGLNYLKGLKIGGFTITLQQIFEYMFMIFFFIYIVTTLQKLYHSFTGVERQEIRSNQRDIQIDRTSFSENPDLSNVGNHNPWFDVKGINPSDTYENIKLSSWESKDINKMDMQEFDSYAQAKKDEYDKQIARRKQFSGGDK